MQEKLKAEKIKSIICSISPTLLTNIIYFKNFKKILNLNKPVDINEKLQYLKLNTYNNNPIITQCVDKYEVRKYLEKFDLKGFCPKLYGVYDSVDEIKWDKLPNSFVVKCNHGSAMNILCPDKNMLDLDVTKKIVDKWMHSDYWKAFAEVQYKNVKKKIIIEELLAPNILTYKFYCFNGIIKVAYVSLNGENGEKEKYFDYFDPDWNWLPIMLWPHENASIHPEKPKGYEEMCRIAKILAAHFPFVRVDLYNIDGKIYFSELTFVPTGGMMQLTPKSVLKEWGDWLELF